MLGWVFFNYWLWYPVGKCAWEPGQHIPPPQVYTGCKFKQPDTMKKNLAVGISLKSSLILYEDGYFPSPPPQFLAINCTVADKTRLICYHGL